MYKDHWLQEETQVSQQDECQVGEEQGHRELCTADPCQEHYTQRDRERAKAALQTQQQEMGGEVCYKLLPHKKGQF